MFNSVILNIIIGLVFTYLLYSILSTIILELIATWFNWRANILHKAISRLLCDESSKETNSELLKSFYGSPGMRYLAKKDNSKPSYISENHFARTLMFVLSESGKGDTRIDKIINGIESVKGIQTKKQLEYYLFEAQNDLQKFQILLEQWFLETMERAKGWYKKKTQKWLIGIGLVIAVTFNVNTIEITHKLSKDKHSQEQMVKLAATFIENSDGNVPVSIAKNKEELLDAVFDNYQAVTETNSIIGGWKEFPCEGYPYSILGFLITALAISLGAPFWFDLLNVLMKLRSSNKPNERKLEQGDSKTILKVKG